MKAVVLILCCLSIFLAGISVGATVSHFIYIWMKEDDDGEYQITSELFQMAWCVPAGLAFAAAITSAIRILAQ